MTRDRARKKVVRARMAATGEPYNAAARHLDDAGPAVSAVAPAEIVARADSTLAAPWARIEIRVDRDVTQIRARPQRRLPGPVARLARSAAKAAWKRMSPEMDLASMREMFRQNFRHLAGTGFVEPAADRFQIDFGGYAEMHAADGQYYGGPSGHVLRANNHNKPPDDPLQEPLLLLRKLRDVTEARHVGHETVRGTPCQVVAVRAGAAEFTLWTDEQYIRRIRSQSNTSGEFSSVSTVRTFELWDFGAGDAAADWMRLPDFRAARP